MTRRDVCVCSLEYDEGLPRVRVWAWLTPSFGEFSRSLAEGHIRYLRAALGHARIWIDRANEPAVRLSRTFDYLTFAEQRDKTARAVQRTEEELARERRERASAEARRRSMQATEDSRRNAETHREAEAHIACGVHVAGERGEFDQRCARCGALLVCQHLYNRPLWVGGTRFYAPGEFIERGAHVVGRGTWQAISLGVDAPTCAQKG
jgi:hypothetical protein